MALYDYECHRCNHGVKIQKLIPSNIIGTEFEPSIQCPVCQNPKMTRCIGGGNASFQFKGVNFSSSSGINS